MFKFLRSSPSTRARRRRRLVVLSTAVGVVLVAAAIAWRVGFRHSNRSLRPLVGPVNVVAAAAAKPTTVITFSQGCRTSECHDVMSTAANLHAPVAKDACDACHAPDSGGHVYPVERGGASLCRTCHNITDGVPLRHMAMSDDGCTSCHDPHQSAGPGLLKGGAGSVEQSCAQCHKPTQGSHKHHPYAAGHCEMCHQPHGSPPTNGVKTASGDAGCEECHASTTDALAHSAHAQAKVERSCLACHGPHATDRKALLRNETRELCTSCHEDIKASVAGAVSHDAVLAGKQCITCHNPHASPNAKMLVSDQTAVCNSCHDKSLKAADGRQIPAMPAGKDTDTFIHGPVASGNCAACHTVHGGNHERLLARINPAVLAGGFDARNYALCFSCHSSTLLLSESAFDTGFRNGETNLHRVHITSGGGDRSRSCSTCHVVHAGQRPKLIAEAVSYEGSNWKMPLGFELTAGGGRCAPGCHEPLEYRREAAAPNRVPGGALGLQGGAP